MEAAFEPIIGTRPTYIVPVIATTLAAWLGGLGPGLAATATGTLLTLYFLVAPRGSLQVASSQDAWRIALSVVESVIVSGIAANLHASIRRFERAAQRATALQRVTASLGTANTPDEVVAATLREALTVLGASAGGVFTRSSDGAWLEMIGSSGYPSDLADQFRRVDAASDLPVVRSAATGQPVFLGEVGLSAQQDLRRGVARTGNRAVASLPMIVENYTFGAMGLSFAEPRAFPQAEREFMLSLAGQCAQALERARLLEAERAGRVELAETATLLATLLSSAPIGFAFIDRELRYREFNRALAAMNGSDPEALIGKTVREVVPQLADQLEPALRRSLELGEPTLDLEIVGEGPDAGRFWLEHIYPVVNPSGTTLGVGVVVEETTARRREAAEREANLRARLEAMPHHVWTVPADGGSVDWYNRRWHEYTGLSEKDIAVDGGQGIVHPGDTTDLARAYEIGLREGRAFETEVRLRARDGGYRWFAIRCEPILDAGRIVGWIGTNTDIHERRLAEEATREREARFRWLAEATPQMVWIFDADARLTYVNPAFTELTGLSLEQAQSGDVNVVHPEDMPAFLERGAEATSTASTFRLEMRLRHAERDGYRWFLHQAVPILQDGAITGWYGTSTDIHARKEAEIALRSVAEAQRRFVSDAAHELRAPLTAIQGNLELVERFPEMIEADKREALRDASREAARLGRLVGDMLALARGEAGTQSKAEELDLATVLESALESARPLATGRTLKRSELPRVLVEGDRDQLKQLALILLDNALKYTPEGGTVSLEASRGLDGAEFRVSDTGIGIPRADLERVFERFYRVDASRSPGQDPGGTGLGLPIARQIARHHGGEIRLVSVVGEGTTAIVTLPLAEV